MIRDRVGVGVSVRVRVRVRVRVSVRVRVRVGLVAHHGGVPAVDVLVGDARGEI